MKKVICLMLTVILGCINLEIYANEVINLNSDTLNINGFSAYIVPNIVFDKFLNNVNDIEYLKENSKYVNLMPDYDFFFDAYGSGAVLNMGSADYLADYNNVCNTLYNLGFEYSINDYAFFATPNIGTEFNMPLSIWLNTSDGVKFATIRRVGYNDPNFWDAFKIEFYEPDVYVKKFSLIDAKIIVCGEEMNFKYVKIRNNGANIGLRELMESLGVKVTWNENDSSISLTTSSKSDEGDIGLRLTLGEYNSGTEMYSFKANLIKSGLNNNDEDFTENIRWLSGRNSCVLRMINDKTVVDNLIAEKLINMLLLTDEDYENNVIYYFVIDQEENTVNVCHDSKYQFK